MDKRVECVVVGAIETNCWLYPLDDESGGKRHCVVIDPGDEAPKVISRLTKLEWVPRYIFLTHGHFDHVMALPELLEAFGKGDEKPPRICIHRLDAGYLGKDALPVANILFEEGDTVGPFKVLHVPGHTPGSVGFYDEDAGILFSGDTLFMGDWGRTDLPGGSEEAIQRSLKRLLALDGKIMVYPGHGPSTTIENEAGLLSS